jgi:exodeoxyribonuclease VII small subunit
MSDKKKKSDDIGYAEASAELEQILQDIESGEIDLDVLTDKVERAAALLAVCRQKLAATETKVKKVTTELAKAAEPEAAGDDEDARP